MKTKYVSIIVENARRTPEKLCLVIGGEQVTYGQLLHRVAYLKRLFESQGVKNENNVLITITPSVDFYAAIVAIFSIGAVLVVVDPSMGVKRMNHCINTAKPAAWITHTGKFWYLKWLVSSVRQIPIKIEVSPERSPVDSSVPLPDVISKESGRCLATFTTGSTGMPKMLFRDTSYLLRQSKAISQGFGKVKGLPFNEEGEYECEKDEVGFSNLTMFPLHFMKVGGTCFKQNNIKSFNPLSVINTMADIGVTYGAVSPDLAYKLCSACLEESRPMPIKLMTVGGAPVYRYMVEKMQKAMAASKLMIVYGSTEAEPISFIDTTEKIKAEAANSESGHCLGLPFLDGKLKVIKIDQPGSVEDLEVPTGENGEIIVCGWHVNIDAAAESRLLTDGKGQKWLKTGDAGHLDDAGRVWLVGRTSWKSVKGEQTCWSVIVEEKILQKFKGLTYVSYFLRNGKTYLIVEAPNGLDESQKREVSAFLEKEGIHYDDMWVYTHVPRDRRHNSKPDMAALFPQYSQSMRLFFVSVVIGSGLWLLFSYGTNGLFVFLLLAAFVTLVLIWQLGFVF
eukprot:m.8583 g.8583  ORF g.8583 m.8583 type:complete len:564 (+) comp20720_c0_seq1:88-1779(+)